MIYLKENGEKKTQNNFDSLKLFINVSIPFFSHVVYIYTEPKNLPVVEIHSRVYI